MAWSVYLYALRTDLIPAGIIDRSARVATHREHVYLCSTEAMKRHQQSVHHPIDLPRFRMLPRCISRSARSIRLVVDDRVFVETVRKIRIGIISASTIRREDERCRQAEERRGKHHPLLACYAANEISIRSESERSPIRLRARRVAGILLNRYRTAGTINHSGAHLERSD